MIRTLILTLALFAIAFTGSAQNENSDSTRQKRIVQIKTFKTKVKVMGVLQGRDDLAVIQVLETEKNDWKLKVGDEVLCKFYFTTKPFDGDNYYPGIKGGEVLSADMHARKNKNEVQVNYNILRYQVLETTIKVETNSNPQ